jgi:signal transduction histidine kinase
MEFETAYHIASPGASSKSILKNNLSTGGRHLLFILLTLALSAGVFYLQEIMSYLNISWQPLTTLYAVHDWQRMLFLIPICYAGYYFRIKGALTLSVISFFAMLPHALELSRLPIATQRLGWFTVSAAVIGMLTAVLHNRNEFIAHSAEIARSERARLLDVLNGIELAVCIIGSGYKLKFANAAMEAWCGKVDGRKCFEYLRKLGEPCPECRLKYILEGNDSRWEFTDENGRVVQVDSSPLHDYDGAISQLALFRDITERRQIENELKTTQSKLQTLSANVAETSEAVQNDIARELHDQIGQSLLCVGMELDSLQKKVIKQETKNSLKLMVSSINQLIENIRSICNELRPVWLDELGLLEAIDVYAEEFEKRSGISCTVFYKTKKLPELSDNAKLAAYRIVQEALTNIMRHSQAREVRINIEFDDNLFNLYIIDDGTGFEMPKSQSGTIGLRGMEERAIMVGGACEVTSAKGKGTQVHLHIPVSSCQVEPAL